MILKTNTVSDCLAAYALQGVTRALRICLGAIQLFQIGTWDDSSDSCNSWTHKVSLRVRRPVLLSPLGTMFRGISSGNRMLNVVIFTESVLWVSYYSICIYWRCQQLPQRDTMLRLRVKESVGTPIASKMPVKVCWR